MDVVTGLTSIQAAISCLKGITSALKSVKEIDQKIIVLNIREQLAELQERLLDARDENNDLMRQNQELRDLLKLRDEIQHQEDGNILWRIVDDKQKGPYCSTCYGADDKLIPLSAGNGEGVWHCPKCKNHFHTRQWNEEQRRQLARLNHQHGR